jgi:hypothetical protein
MRIDAMNATPDARGRCQRCFPSRSRRPRRRLPDAGPWCSERVQPLKIGNHLDDELGSSVCADFTSTDFGVVGPP